MVNANCDFCSKTYRKHLSVGYFRVSAGLMSILCIREGADLNTKCGDHFMAADIEESGMLRPGARPVFSPRLSTTSLDHSYYATGAQADADEGTVDTTILGIISILVHNKFRI